MEDVRELFDWKSFLEKNGMQLRPDAPSLSRPGSPQKHTITLPGIPEATPGPNAFAQQALRMDRERLESHTFYQQEVQRRQVTPPTDTHPAFRHDTTADRPPVPTLMTVSEQRDSSVTTMSRFIEYGQKKTPVLKLMPSPNTMNLAEPTIRSFVEERHEQMVHELSGGERERTPGYASLPQTNAMHESSKPGSTPRKLRIAQPSKGGNSMEPPSSPKKSPKRSFFDRLGMSKLLGASPSPSTSTLASSSWTENDEDVPPKAQAVLGASPSKTNARRSPSKLRKGLFSGRQSIDAWESSDGNVSKVSFARKGASESQSLGSRHMSSQKTPQAGYSDPLMTGSTQVNRTPKTGVSDPTHYSFRSGKHAPSQTFSNRDAVEGEDKKCAITRSQSLKYFDHVPPPTPPAKNTPPDVKARADAVQSLSVPFHQSQPTPSKGITDFVSTAPNRSPTRFGSYGQREMPRLVTRPSVYSMHASVVPELTDATTFEAMKGVESLGLEGFSMPSESQHHATSDLIYSPSVYSIEWGPGAARPHSVMHQLKSDESPAVKYVPTQPGYSLHSDTHAHRNKDSDSSHRSAQTIEVCYPAVGSDPSIHDLTSLVKQPSDSGLSRHERGGLHPEGHLPAHGCTHSRDHSESPVLANTRGSWLSKDDGVDASLFAVPINDELRDHNHQSPASNASPASFNHPSAMPSPLHYLPATVYTPPLAKAISLALGAKVSAGLQNSPSAERTGLGIRGTPRNTSTSPSRSKHPLENAPLLEPDGNNSKRASPRPGLSGHRDADGSDVEPRKYGVSAQPDKKLDQMLVMLSRLNARNDDFASMRDEMRATNARLDERLAVIEHVQRTSPAPSSPTSEISFQQHDERMREARQRVATGAAHEYYRQLASPPNSATEVSVEAVSAQESETIAELRETKKRLEAMLNRYAEKLEEMERKILGKP